MTLAKTNAFLDGIDRGKFNNQKSKIFNLLKKKPLTLEMLILHGYPEKTASARISDLMDLGLVQAKGEKISFFYVVLDSQRQIELINQRKEINYNKWVQKGTESGFMRRYMMENIL